MALAWTKRAQAQNASANPQNVTSIPATTAGALLVAFVALRTGTTNSVTSITDSAGNTWTLQTMGFATGANTKMECWTSVGAASITSLTVNLSASVATSVTLFEVTGASSATPVNVKTTSGSTSGDTTSDTSYTAGTLTPSAGGNYLLLHGVNWATTSTVATFTPPAGYASEGFQTGTSTRQGHGVISQAVSVASGSYGGVITGDVATTNGYAAIAIADATNGASGSASRSFAVLIA